MSGFEYLWQALQLQRDAYTALSASSAGMRFALGVVFVGGLSAAIGQSLVLFANRVRPRRFFWSLMLSAALFVFTYLFWATSTWLVASFVFDQRRPYVEALRTVGLAYVPQFLAFLTITPYFGSFVSAVLSTWTLLGIIVATSVTFDLSTMQAIASSALGWVLLQVAQRTVGRPIVRIATRLRGAVAGQTLQSVSDALQPNDRAVAAEGAEAQDADA